MILPHPEAFFLSCFRRGPGPFWEWCAGSKPASFRAHCRGLDYRPQRRPLIGPQPRPDSASSQGLTAPSSAVCLCLSSGVNIHWLLRQCQLNDGVHWARPASRSASEIDLRRPISLFVRCFTSTHAPVSQSPGLWYCTTQPTTNNGFVVELPSHAFCPTVATFL